MKIALGSAQFGMDYGINNVSGKIPKDEVFKILKKAIESGVEIIDTAKDYGTSLEIIGEFIKNNLKYKKIKIVSKDKCDNINKIKKNVNFSLGLLNIDRLYALLVHNFKNYASNPSIWDEFVRLKRENKVEKIGFSLNYPEELEAIINDELKPDLVQIPYNIFDRRFSVYLSTLKKNFVEIHARSVFLQGLFFKDPEELGKYFEPIKDKIKKIKELSINNKIPISNLCINFVNNNKFIDNIIIGVDSAKNLEENLNFNKINLTEEIFNELVDLQVNNEKIIIPSNWPNQKKIY